MADIEEFDLRDMGNTFAVHYGGELESVNAYTFANSLVAFADAMRRANAIVYPGLDLEVAITAQAPGSFRAQIKAIPRSLQTIFQSQVVGNVIGGVITGLILHAWLGGSRDPEIVINGDVVILNYEGGRTIMPRGVYDAFEATKDSRDVQGAIEKAFEVLESDESVEDFGIGKDARDPRLLYRVPRLDFARVRGVPADSAQRVREERTRLEILRVLFERGRRRWQFLWHGSRISAPILDDQFFDRVERREILMGAGDVLEVTLRITQAKVDGMNLWENKSYEVVTVHGHQPRPDQAEIR